MRFRFKSWFRKADKGMLSLILLFLIFTPIFLTPWVEGNDRLGYYTFPRTIVIDHDLDMENEFILYQDDEKNVDSIKYDNSTGKYYTMFPVGTGVLWTPFMYVGHAMTYLTGGEMDGYSYYYVLMVSLASVLFGFLGLIIIYKLLREYFSEFVSFISVLTIWLSTNLFYYMYLEPVMSHCFSMSLAAIFVYLWHKTLKKRTYLEWLILGIVAGLVFIVRFQNGLFFLIPLAESLKKYYDGIKRRRMKFPSRTFIGNIFFLFGILLGYLPQMIYFWYSHGYLFRFWEHYNKDKLSLGFGISNLPNIFFSPNHGLIYWTPILLLSLAGLYFFMKKHDFSLGFWLSIVFLLQVFAVSSYERWHGAQSFGNRIFIVFTILFCLGLASLFEEIRLILRHRKLDYRIVLWGILIIFTIWNFGLMMQYGAGMIPPDGPVYLSEMARNNFSVIPRRAFEIIRDFLFSRGRFL